MIVLPSLENHVKLRPGILEFGENVFVPDFTTYPDFWEHVRPFFYALSVNFPIVGDDILSKIDESHGFFGHRIHPVTEEPNHYHISIDINTRAKQQVKPIANGILEYSGFSVDLGYYVLLSHPQVQTENGYVLHSMYYHLKKPLVKFNSYQKMMREISLGSHPKIEIKTDTAIGIVGSSGLATKGKPKLSLRCDFRKFDHKPIVVDPMNFYSQKVHVNDSKEDMKV